MWLSSHFRTALLKTFLSSLVFNTEASSVRAAVRGQLWWGTVDWTPLTLLYVQYISASVRVVLVVRQEAERGTCLGCVHVALWLHYNRADLWSQIALTNMRQKLNCLCFMFVSKQWPTSKCLFYSLIMDVRAVYPNLLAIYILFYCTCAQEKDSFKIGAEAEHYIPLYTII